MKKANQIVTDVVEQLEKNEYEILMDSGEVVRIAGKTLKKSILEKYLEIIRNNNYYSVWLSYDLGLEENVEKVTKKRCDELYQKRYKPFMNWLKQHDAVECGKSVAKFIAVGRNIDHLLDEFKKELKAAKIEREGIRIYVVISDLANFLGNQKDYVQDKIRFAGFIIGEREAAAWEDYKKLGCERVERKNIDIEN